MENNTLKDYISKKPNKYKLHLYTPLKHQVQQEKVLAPYWKNCHEQVPDNAWVVNQNLMLPRKMEKVKYFRQKFTNLNET